MEGQLPQRAAFRMKAAAMTRMTRQGFAVLLLGALACAQAPAYAGGGGMTGGALEITSLANNAELVTNAANTLNTVRNTLQSSLYLAQDLKQLDPATISQLVGFPLQQVGQMVDLYNQVTNSLSAYQQFQQQLQQFRQGAAGANMTPGQYLQYMAYEARTTGGVYQQELSAAQRTTQNLQQQSQMLQQTASQIPNVTSEVGGMQQLMVQNTQTQSLLMSVAQSLNSVVQMQAIKNSQETAADSAALNQQSADQANWAAAQAQAPQANWTLPDPTKIPINGASSVSGK